MPERAGVADADDAVLDRWLAHHYRHHQGEIQDCPALGCQAYTEVMTRG